MTELRDVVISEITHAARIDPKIMILSSDFGAPALDEFRRDLPNQFLSVGIAEQNMIDVAAGLALSGRQVFCYAMAPFITGRCWEQIKCSLSSMNLPVVLIGVGVGLGYDRVSMTHLAVDDLAIMRAINHLEIQTPSDDRSAIAITRDLLSNPRFCYLRLERGHCETLVRESPFTVNGMSPVRFAKTGIRIVACGSMVRTAMAAAHNWGHGVLDIQRIKPLHADVLASIVANDDLIITVEEHIQSGGLGSVVLEALPPQEHYKVRCLAIKDGFEVVNGDRNQLRRRFGIDDIAVHQAIGDWSREPGHASKTRSAS